MGRYLRRGADERGDMEGYHGEAVWREAGGGQEPRGADGEGAEALGSCVAGERTTFVDAFWRGYRCSRAALLLRAAPDLQSYSNCTVPQVTLMLAIDACSRTAMNRTSMYVMRRRR